MTTDIRKIIIFTLLAIGFPIQNSNAKEPYYKERALSDWICCASASEQNVAFENIGTNAVPLFLEILSEGGRGVNFGAAHYKSSELRNAMRDQAIRASIKETISHAFWIYGTNADFAVPKLVELLKKGNDEVSEYAAAALCAVGPNGFLALSNILSTSKSPEVLLAAIAGIGQNSENPKDVALLLVPLFKNPAEDVRQSAVANMAGQDPAIAIPALINVLDDQNTNVIQAAISALSSYRQMAKIAAPKILSIFTNSPDIKTLEYLNLIDPETESNAESIILNRPLNPLRDGYTKTKLKNGLELIAGGCVNTRFSYPKDRTLSNAELYDPITGKWTETGKMKQARCGHIAILLADGRVLVVAGYGEKGALASAEIYDPEKREWSMTTSLKQPYGDGAGVLLPDGRAMIYTGGWSKFVPPRDEIIYNPASGTWGATNGPVKMTQ